ncbi:MAG: hypothetical protein HQK77_06890 [Desulfobacterales bacterium]|nr:hypothetical protein [Desulfobacterales bacterium]
MARIQLTDLAETPQVLKNHESGLIYGGSLGYDDQELTELKELAMGTVAVTAFFTMFMPPLAPILGGYMAVATGAKAVSYFFT